MNRFLAIAVGIACLAISSTSFGVKPKKKLAVSCPAGQKSSLLAPATCEPIGGDEDRLAKQAKLPQAPVTKTDDETMGNRFIACRITSDCPAGLFCTPNGYCAKTSADVAPIK